MPFPFAALRRGQTSLGWTIIPPCLFFFSRSRHDGCAVRRVFSGSRLTPLGSVLWEAEWRGCTDVSLCPVGWAQQGESTGRKSERWGEIRVPHVRVAVLGGKKGEHRESVLFVVQYAG